MFMANGFGGYPFSAVNIVVKHWLIVIKTWLILVHSGDKYKSKPMAKLRKVIIMIYGWCLLMLFHACSIFFHYHPLSILEMMEE